jgi:hypothetical protein
MPVFSAEQLNRWSLQAEQKFIEEFQILIDRTSLPVVSGTNLYLLDDNIINIRRITYRGTKLEPITHRDVREYLDGPDSSGKPYAYVFNNIGQLTIKLIPTPTETLANSQIDLFNPDVIREQCIVEFYTAPNGVEYKIPDYIRRRLLKAYVLKMAFLSEGKGQNLKASKYWDAKWKMYRDMYGYQIYDLLNTPRRLIQSEGYRRFPAFPVLPTDKFGIGLNPGE